MKLGTKLKLSFVIISIIPILLMSSVVILLGIWQVKDINSSYDTEIADFTSFTNPAKFFGNMADKVFKDVSDVLENDVDKIESSEYLEEINKKLLKKFSFMVVTKNDKVIYSGSDKSISDIIGNLPSYSECVDMKNNFYVNGEKQYIVRDKTFNYSDGGQGVVFIFTGIDGIIPQLKALFLELLVAMVLIILITGAILTIWIYSSVLRPMNRLTEATRKISEGDLDFTLEAETDDEFGKLCQDFEEMRKRLKQSTEDKIRDDEESKELISNISHDLKTPITAIKGYVEGIMDGVADTPEKMDKYIHTIYIKANDMDRLIAELTTYSRIDTNRMPYNFTKVNVDDYFNDCVDELAYELDSKNIKLTYFNYTDKDTVIIADVEQLKRVINNIVSNSVKYIGKKQGTLNIRINDEGDFIRVEIEDNGKGIDSKDLPYIFDRFYRTDSSRNSNQGGSGIGLSIVKKIIEAHGGKIWATSRIGTGTTMHFVIRKYVENIVDTENERVDENEQNIDSRR